MSKKLIEIKDELGGEFEIIEQDGDYYVRAANIKSDFVELLFFKDAILAILKILNNGVRSS